MALGNAKILYGSEKFKFYGSLTRWCSTTHADTVADVVLAYSKPEAMFAAILVCSFNDASKILRKEVAACPIAAARAIVYGLHVDTGLLLSECNSYFLSRFDADRVLQASTMSATSSSVNRAVLRATASSVSTSGSVQSATRLMTRTILLASFAAALELPQAREPIGSRTSVQGETATEAIIGTVTLTTVSRRADSGTTTESGHRKEKSSWFG